MISALEVAAGTVHQITENPQETWVVLKRQ